ncbi:unnamed protein product, partial [Heterotrigona itama]
STDERKILFVYTSNGKVGRNVPVGRIDTDVSLFQNPRIEVVSLRRKQLKMFAPKTQTSNSTFYTELESDEAADGKGEPNESKECDVGKESDDRPEMTEPRDRRRREEAEYDGRSFHKIASFGSFSRFRSFVMSAGSSAEQQRIVVEEEEEEEEDEDEEEEEEESEENSNSNSTQGVPPLVRVSRGMLEYRNS